MKVKLMLLMCLVLIAVVDGFLFRRRRRGRKSSSKSKTTVSGGLDCARGSGCSGTVSATRTWNKDRTSLGGQISCQSGGGCGAGIQFKHRFKRQALRDANKFLVTLSLPTCNFESYDLDGDGKIMKEELDMWFEEDNQILIDSFFASLDTDGNAHISVDEFIRMAPLQIAGCDEQAVVTGKGNAEDGNKTQKFSYT
uniref:EF-hand domain-containing protein n=1 Tax=Pinctada fucata TaxID=50426 RepID=A0A194AN77_PINFU